MDAKNEMIRKGGTLLDACEVITVASVDGKGYPRPVPVVKLAAEGCGQIWFATGAGSRKTAQFRANPKAGVSFFAGQDSVVLTGVYRRGARSCTTCFLAGLDAGAFPAGGGRSRILPVEIYGPVRNVLDRRRIRDVRPVILSLLQQICSGQTMT